MAGRMRAEPLAVANERTHQDRKPSGFLDLIEALTILSRYSDARCPTHCEYEELYVMVPFEDVSEADRARLEELSFKEDTHGEYFSSYRFGSA